MGTKRGQKTKVWGASQGCDGNATGDSHNGTGQNSSQPESERQIGTDCPDWTGENRAINSGKDFDGGREADSGKILSQLRGLKESHLAYVKAHEERLEARLTENREHQSRVIAEMNRLEQEIMELLQEQEKLSNQ